LRRQAEERTHVKLELVSPNPSSKGSVEKKSEDKKMKPPVSRSFIKSKIAGNQKPQQEEFPVTTAVMKVNLHCQGCIQKMCRRITKTRGYKEMKIDRQKELVTVVGAMDMSALAEALRKQMKKSVEILPPPEKKESIAVEKTKKNGAAKTGAGGGGAGKEKGSAGGTAEPGKEENQIPNDGPQSKQNPGHNGSSDRVYCYYQPNSHAPQMFSDENPNACFIM
ncbi:hypothetical protein M569_11345, partial [Genlisea aurea]